MAFAIVHIGVRVHPELVARVSAQVDGSPVEVNLDRDVLEHLCGADLGDEQAILLALNHHAKAIGIAIEAYAYAGGVPPDGHIVLSWEDFRPTVEELVEAGARRRELA